MKLKVAIVFGGKSTEHEISLLSASNIFNAIDQNRFKPSLLGVDKCGNWRYNPSYLEQNINLTTNDYFAEAVPVYLSFDTKKVSIIDQKSHEILHQFDLVFPITHGTSGEDGVLQGFLKFMNIPFVGPDVLGSAVAMDKDVTKRLLRDAGIPIAAFFTLYKHAPKQYSYAEIVQKLGLPLFVKPANAGSSVGVSKATDEASFEEAITNAFRFDNKILVEEAVIGKEIECAVLGNQEAVEASVIGEIIPTKTFYSFEAKYQDDNGAKMKIPATIDAATSEKIRLEAIKAFQTIACEGMSRVDFFLRPDGTFVLNEVNTLPGFTKISMYPKLWENTGLSYKDLITKLIQIGLSRYERDNALVTSR